MPSPTRIALAATLLSFATLASAQSPAGSHWACTMNGKDVDIKLTSDQATVAMGGETRVLKRQDAQSENVYYDGNVTLRFKGDTPAPSNSPRLIENNKPSQLSKCTELDA